MGWSPAQVGALENCGIKVEDATGDIKWREFETVDIIKPEPIKSPKSNIQYIPAIIDFVYFWDPSGLHFLSLSCHFGIIFRCFSAPRFYNDFWMDCSWTFT